MFLPFFFFFQVAEFEQDTKEDAKKGLIEADEQLLAQLTDMGIPEYQARRALIGTKNGGLDQAFGYIEEHENDPEFNKPTENSNEANTKKQKKPRQIPLEIQRLFTQLQLINRCEISTDGK